MAEVELRGPFRDLWQGKNVFAIARDLQGKIYRHKEGRRTLRFEIDGHGYFIKYHHGVGWREILKNLSQLRMPVVGASNEWNAINRLRQLDVDTLYPLAYGRKGVNPAKQESFLITEELVNTKSLAVESERWFKEGVDVSYKRQVLNEVARVARTIHRNGINHRDFYLCHFLVGHQGENHAESDRPVPLHLVDLHRAQMRRQVPWRWLVKDVGSLYYSALDVGFTQRDFLRFLRDYYQQPLRQILQERRRFLRAITQRAIRIYLRDFKRTPQLPFADTGMRT